MEYYMVKPAGGDLCMDYCINNKLNLLFSYYLDKGTIVNKILNKRRERTKEGLSNGKLFLDSGAFTAWTKGVTVNVDDYVKFINEYGDCIDYFGQLDVIPIGNKTEVVEKSAKETLENYYDMISRINYKDKLVYTFHVGEPIEYLIEALKWGSEHKDIMKRIALGGLVKKNKATKEAFMKRVFPIIKQYYPEVKVHLFGTTTDYYFKNYPADAGDSSNYIQTSVNGGVDTPYGIIRFGNKTDKHHYGVYNKESKEVLDKYFKSIDINPEDLDKDDVRMLANIKYIENKYFKNTLKSYNNGKREKALF